MYNTLKYGHTISFLTMKSSQLHVQFHRLPQKSGNSQPSTGFMQYFPIVPVKFTDHHQDMMLPVK